MAKLSNIVKITAKINLEMIVANMDEIRLQIRFTISKLC